MRGFHVLDNGRWKHFHGRRGSSASVQHDVFFDVRQYRATQFGVPAPGFASPDDVANGVFLSQFKG